jgi:hypothetical protein
MESSNARHVKQSCNKCGKDRDNIISFEPAYYSTERSRTPSKNRPRNCSIKASGHGPAPPIAVDGTPQDKEPHRATGEFYSEATELLGIVLQASLEANHPDRVASI